MPAHAAHVLAEATLPRAYAPAYAQPGGKTGPPLRAPGLPAGRAAVPATHLPWATTW
ncbi:MAG: hypothetical protein WKG07_04385 [Hymenobacter sp.]